MRILAFSDLQIDAAALKLLIEGISDESYDCILGRRLERRSEKRFYTSEQIRSHHAQDLYAVLRFSKKLVIGMQILVRDFFGENPQYVVGGEVMATPISASGPWILLLAAVAIAIAIPLLSRRISIKILQHAQD